MGRFHCACVDFSNSHVYQITEIHTTLPMELKADQEEVDSCQEVKTARIQSEYVCDNLPMRTFLTGCSNTEKTLCAR